VGSAWKALAALVVFLFLIPGAAASQLDREIFERNRIDAVETNENLSALGNSPNRPNGTPIDPLINNNPLINPNADNDSVIAEVDDLEVDDLEVDDLEVDDGNNAESTPDFDVEEVEEEQPARAVIEIGLLDHSFESKVEVGSTQIIRLSLYNAGEAAGSIMVRVEDILSEREVLYSRLVTKLEPGQTEIVFLSWTVPREGPVELDIIITPFDGAVTTLNLHFEGVSSSQASFQATKVQHLSTPSHFKLMILVISLLGAGVLLTRLRNQGGSFTGESYYDHFDMLDLD